MPNAWMSKITVERTSWYAITWHILGVVLWRYCSFVARIEFNDSSPIWLLNPYQKFFLVVAKFLALLLYDNSDGRKTILSIYLSICCCAVVLASRRLYKIFLSLIWRAAWHSRYQWFSGSEIAHKNYNLRLTKWILSLLYPWPCRSSG